VTLSIATMHTFWDGAGFGCAECGSPSIVVPKPLAASGSVACGGCGRHIGTWSQFCSGVDQRLASGAALAVARKTSPRSAVASSPAAGAGSGAAF
jgi:hypothetical protein